MGNWDESREVPALIVLDINMPLVSGDEAYKRIKENAKFNSTVIVFLSTCFRFEHPEYFKEMTYRFNKPFAYGEYQKVIQEIVSLC